MRALLSADAVRMRDPSGLKAAEFTEYSWPRRTAISFPLTASQMRAVLSPDAVTMRDPSGLKRRNSQRRHGRREYDAISLAIRQRRAQQQPVRFRLYRGAT